MSRNCCEAMCGWAIIFIFVYLVGFNNILDFILSIVEWIPIVHYPIEWFISIIKFLFNTLPFYYLYVILICGLNVLYYVIFQRDLRYGANRVEPKYIGFVVLVCLIIPNVISLILVNWNVVFYFILPFHMAAAAFFVGLPSN